MSDKNISFNINHPELRNGEMFIENVIKQGDFWPHQIRYGKQGFNRDGKKVDLIPVFAEITEVEEYEAKWDSLKKKETT